MACVARSSATNLACSRNVERFLLVHAHQVDDAGCLFLSQRDIRHALDVEFFGTAATSETVQQPASLRHVDALQRLLDATLDDRRQQARFGSVIPQPIALINGDPSSFVPRFGSLGGPSRRVLMQENAEHIRGGAAGRCCVVSLFFAARQEFLAVDRPAFEHGRDHQHIRQDA